MSQIKNLHGLVDVFWFQQRSKPQIQVAKLLTSGLSAQICSECVSKTTCDQAPHLALKTDVTAQSTPMEKLTHVTTPPFT